MRDCFADLKMSKLYFSLCSTSVASDTTSSPTKSERNEDHNSLLGRVSASIDKIFNRVVRKSEA